MRHVRYGRDSVLAWLDGRALPAGRVHAWPVSAVTLQWPPAPPEPPRTACSWSSQNRRQVSRTRTAPGACCPIRRPRGLPTRG
jgi:hypothetical protein